MAIYLYVTNLNINNDDLLHAIAREHCFTGCFQHVDLLTARLNMTALLTEDDFNIDFCAMLQDLAEQGFKMDIRNIPAI